jgi:hypothetical protein
VAPGSKEGWSWLELSITNKTLGEGGGRRLTSIADTPCNFYINLYNRDAIQH